MLSVNQLEHNLASIKKLIGNHQVTIVAVTKQQPATIYELCRAVNLTHVAENRAQEVRQKSSNLAGLILHFIAPIQKKNIKYLVGKIHTFDALSDLATAQELNLSWQKAQQKLAVLLQLNCTGEQHKSGLPAQDFPTVLAFAQQVKKLPSLELQGVMAMGPTPKANYKRGNANYEKDLRSAFKLAQETHRQLEAALGHALPRLSLGMSNDYDVALEYNSTELRLGTLLWQEKEV